MKYNFDEIIDRLMGFRLSTLLQKKIKSQSAGRVQSVVLKFLVDREKEIKDFVPEEYWTIQGIFGSGENSIFLSFNSEIISFMIIMERNIKFLISIINIKENVIKITFNSSNEVWMISSNTNNLWIISS